MSNPHLQRAHILFSQQRHEQAAGELRQALGKEPQRADAHSLLAICLAELKQWEEAEREAGEGIVLAPDDAFAYYARAWVLSERERLAEAEEAIGEAIRLDPENADYHAWRAQILLRRERWVAALEAAEEGLRFDPEHTGANNLRAMALTHLGRREEAGQTIREVLAREPEDALSHANQGWTLLHQGRRREAWEHFREALRLDPENEWARAGGVEALKAGNPFYAVMLKYFLWTGRLSSQARWGLIIGLWFGHRVLRNVAETHPQFAPWIAPISVLYFVFVLSTWLADPLCNFLLRFHRHGRYLLSETQRRQANAVSVPLGLGVLGVLGWLVTGRQQPDFLVSAALLAGLMIPLAGTFSCQPGWPRTAMTLVSTLLALLALAAVAFVWIDTPVLPDEKKPALSGIFIGLYVLGLVAVSILALALSQVKPAR